MSSGLGDVDAMVHPLVRLVEDLDQVIETAADGHAWTLTPRELTDLLPRLDRARRRLDAVGLRMLREADRHQIGDPIGHASTAGWWATVTRTTKRDAHRQVALAEALDDERPVAAAVGAGAASLDQAAVILTTIDTLPADLGPALRHDAETHLVGLATQHDPKDLRILGRKVLEVIAPDIAEAHERRILEDQERHAAATASFTMRPDGHGSYYGRFKIPTLAGEILAKHLAAIAAPRHRHANPTGTAPATDTGIDSSERVSRPLRLGTAFIEYLETRPTPGIPHAGGIPATLTVTMTLHDLVGDTDTPATLDTGETITAGQARRLACEAGIIPAVLGTPSQVLDLGRRTRFHTQPQRTALQLRDRGCRAQHCDWPPGMCHTHHTIPWSQGGPTTVTGALLLCPRHHTLAHDRRYQIEHHPGGRISFTRRT
jgi:hypothetical protein